MPSADVSELQKKLFKRMGLTVPEDKRQTQKRQFKQAKGSFSQVGLRKAQRAQKRAQGHPKQVPSAKKHINGAGFSRPERNPPRRQASPDESSSDDDIQSDIDDHTTQLDGKDEDFSQESDDDHGSGSDIEDESDYGLEGESDSESDEAHAAQKDSSKYDGLSSAVREKLAQDDKEIEEFEKKLRIKKGATSLPKAFRDDGLDEILGDAGTDPETTQADEPLKRKRQYDDWLASKRRKAMPDAVSAPLSGSDMLDGSGDEDDFNFSDEDSATHDQEEDSSSRPQAKVKENPYVAPATGAVVAKYVPPSLRKAAGSESEARMRLQKQIQGLVNRLTEANILQIVKSVEDLYQNNARGDITEILTSTLLAQMYKSASVPDQFLVLIGGFSAAVYKVIGSSFGSHLIQQVVVSFGDSYKHLMQSESDLSEIPKEASNILGFLTQLYLFEVVSCRIIFDYMERLLADLNELNVELLLRICRMAGRLLRRDDPNALKHVTSILNKAITEAGPANLSVRTKFMVETINDLGKSKPKARGIDSSIVSDHVLRIRKKLGELKSQSRRLDGLAPMGLSLHDIEKADTRGKWWLVGASVPAKETYQDTENETKSTSQSQDNDLSDDIEDMDIVLPDFPKKARGQGFHTSAQIAIFTAIMSAADYEHGYRQYANLKLRKDDQAEIARVLVQCVGSEAHYNEYYALVGKQACTNNKIRFAFQDRLWRIFRSLGELMFGEEAEEEETADSEKMKDERRISHVARFYADLISTGALNINILKPLNLPRLNSWTFVFVEQLIVSLLQACRGNEAKESVRITKLFGVVAEVPSLAAGLDWFLRKKLRKSKLLTPKEMKKLERVRVKAEATVQAQTAGEH
ncbi:suppressor of glycerol defect [Trichoderma arundinaceum]|uniref:Suppressor of glycerol defect n=1 Tax=Trichoderma arundinaceum TaxID=490622 RepID=A0A395N9B9_TRIAR|nr:suppressor of glycerol defect [Trichoderma arundinaceum]